MNYDLIENLETSTAHCLVFGFFEDKDHSSLKTVFGKEELALIARFGKKLEKAGDWLWQEEMPNGKSLLIMHCGEAKAFNAQQLQSRLGEVVDLLLKQQAKSAVIALPQVQGFSANWQLKQMLLQIDAQTYPCPDFKTSPKKAPALKNLSFILPHASQEALKVARITAEVICLTKSLANRPANLCTPSFLGEEAQALAKEHASIQTQVFGPQEQKELGMGALLAVAQGSAEPSAFIEMVYTGSKASEAKPIVLIGKGITFDSGGLSLKTPDCMVEMKYDMCGAASVLATIKACALLELPINVVGLIPSTENLPSGTALKPGDIINSMSGQTIEVLNTDAEGRLILADALTYAERFDPRFVIDIATLTGAIIIALGYHTTGLMTEDEALADSILKAAQESGDRCWRLPMDEPYQSALDSPMADMINASFDRVAGSITAACFLSRYAQKFRWAHLDVAGTAWITGKNRRATGRPVPLLIQLLCDAAYQS